jgi:hypothetical protein
VYIKWENCAFYVGTMQRISLSSDDIYSDSALMIGLINVQLFNVFKVCLNSRRWFVLCLVCVPYLVLVLVSGLGTSSIGRVQLKTETEPSPPKHCLLNKNGTMDNVQKHNNYNNLNISTNFSTTLVALHPVCGAYK